MSALCMSSSLLARREGRTCAWGPRHTPRADCRPRERSRTLVSQKSLVDSAISLLCAGQSGFGPLTGGFTGSEIDMSVGLNKRRNHTAARAGATAFGAGLLLAGAV